MCQESLNLCSTESPWMGMTGIAKFGASIQQTYRFSVRYDVLITEVTSLIDTSFISFHQR